MNILITGGAGFVGSNLAIKLKTNYPDYSIYCVDNLVRRGSELNLSSLREHGIAFKHADIRMAEDLIELPLADVIIDASADPSVLAGISSSSVKLIQSNLWGTVNLLELAIEQNAKFIFLSTSRVYPFGQLNRIALEERAMRFELAKTQTMPGVSHKGISEDFTLSGARSFYGAAKLCSELLINEYIELKGLKATILRCGVIAGPGQFGKVDQGILVHWLASHYWKRDLSYIGFGGGGKQVRDFLHISDLFGLIEQQIQKMDLFSGRTLNVGGGLVNAISLVELTKLCSEIVGHTTKIKNSSGNRVADIPLYISDNTKLYEMCDWRPTRTCLTILQDTFDWLKKNETDLKKVL